MKMKKLIPAVGGLALSAGAINATDSSHREAPMIGEDQFVDNTDVYAFISPTDSTKLVMVATYVPLLIPASGPNFYRFSEDARYENVALQAIKTDNGIKSFAGPRDAPFFVDLHVFDLLGVGGAPTTDGINVMSIVLEVPITDIAAGGARPASSTDKTSVVGIYASATRPQIRILRKGRDAVRA